jgi:carbon-monoxide dehydrogenase medium subunit
MSLWNHYYQARNLVDALQALQELPQPARLIAGGTDLLLQLQQGQAGPVESLVDINGIPALQALEICNLPSLGETLFVGAAVTLSRIAGHPQAGRHASALVDACQLIGGPQVRNSATLGGNVAHALPAADGSIALLALNATAEVYGSTGNTLAPLDKLYLGPGKSALNPVNQILVGFHLPLAAPGHASAFLRIMRPQGVALPVLNMACWLHREGDQIVDLRLTLGPAGTKPMRAPVVEEALRGQFYSQAVIETAGKSLAASSRFRTSPRRASSTYRQHLSQVLLPAVLAIAWERADVLHRDKY